MTLYDLTMWANVPQLIKDEEYAKSKGVMIKQQEDLFIIRYKKYNLTDKNCTTLGLFRSIITDGKSLICFSPPKSMHYLNFTETFDKKEYRLEEFIEGTMINCFWWKGDWGIATRGNIGAESAFYQDINTSFKIMFLEAMKECNLTFDSLDKNYSYSFVLQHPSNRIVVPFSRPHLVLIAKYKMIDSWCAQEVITLSPPAGTHITVPKQYDVCSGKTLEEAIKPYTNTQTHYTVLGVMIKHPSGVRCKIRNPTYEKVRHLKGNSPKIQFQYYNLYQSGKIKDFLHYYPEYKQTFWNFRLELLKWTQELGTLYRNYYIHKTIQEKDIPYPFRPHVWALHDIYRLELRAKNMSVNKQVVIDYIHNLPPSRIMYAINYPLRQKEKDDIMGISQSIN